jgi:glycosyltransferase involved in cell wall biosynthesis
MKVSIVCPIKDEVNLISRTLPSFYSVDPDEVILCLDKPAPRNVTLTIETVAERLGKSKITRILEVERNPSYRFHQAWVRRSGFRAARNDAILTSDIDIVLDPSMKEYFQLLRGDVKLVSFAKFSKTWHGLMAYLIQEIPTSNRFTGLYLFSKAAWLSTEDETSVKTIPRSEDTHLYNSLVKKYRDTFIRNVKNVVLRPGESKKYKFLMGWNRWRARSPMWEVAMSTLVYFRPYMLVGYLDARLRQVKPM